MDRDAAHPVASPDRAPVDASLRELLTKLATDSSRLVKQEAELAKRELEEKVDEIRTETVKAVVAGAVVYAGALAIVAGVALLLGLLLPLWLSAIAIGSALAGGGMAMMKKAKENLSDVGPPRRTVHEAKRDMVVMKEAAR